ncbi:ubiquitin-conjugating enzyme E2-22 kDa isoform X2 [Anopheles cruzii]|uniref:ubiquitin-conjugating enzyme E2-22 kDa isoform X2 n=1 Tax=Anopheles cruzii TaxID=68878 RepID=UPI0022EC798A|nr:ubiquitin-conjugating enzyme E2-22 kDa isoform X2 [Anopheles cruzii]
MANMAVSRIKREFKEVLKSEEIVQCSIKLDMVNDNFTELRGEIAGPPDTPYEGGKFVLEIKVPETYPFNPPKALLAAAEPDDPQDAVVATQYKESHEMFILTAKHWTNVYAGGPFANPDFDQKVQRLRDMGIPEYDARAALSRHNWHLERASEQLFS